MIKLLNPHHIIVYCTKYQRQFKYNRIKTEYKSIRIDPFSLDIFIFHNVIYELYSRRNETPIFMSCSIQ